MADQAQRALLDESFSDQRCELLRGICKGDEWRLAAYHHRRGGETDRLWELCRRSGVLENRDEALSLRRRLADGSACRPVPIWSSAYPKQMRLMRNPPPLIYVRGDVELLQRPAVGVVGARAALPASRRVAAQLAAGLAELGIVVVSGLARGVDGAAHHGALPFGATVAVVGSGADVAYPPYHRQLLGEIVEKGAVVSQFASGVSPRPWHFPARNRVLAGLCVGVVVVQAAERSGALSTARLALEEGREVMVTPGLAAEAAWSGSHRLLRDGAALVETALDVIEAVSKGLREAGWRFEWADPNSGFESDQARLWRALAQRPLTAEELALELSWDGRKAQLALGRMELAGFVRRCGGGRYALRQG